MCGITGYISTERHNHQAMLSSLRHRGPDYSGTYFETNLNMNLFLGHTRLSILDLSENGNQPMQSSDKKVVIVFNGEVYNFEDLKYKFLRGESFISRTDTEVVLKLYQKLGIDFLKELNGDFAMAILDNSCDKLFLIKDRVGVKPLYYYYDNECLVFGSEIKSILASGVKAILNEDELLNYFIFKYVPKNNTLHKNIFRIPPASYLQYNLAQKSFSVHRYWEVQKNNAYHKLSYSEAKHQLYLLLEESCNSRLISDVNIGNFLSGGVDSSIIASFIKNRKDITHYCARKSETDLIKEGTTSDFYFAQKLASEWGINLKGINIGNNEANEQLIKTTLYYSDDLIADGSQIPSYLITKDAGIQSKVILSGMGADELFLGYAGHMLTLLSQNIGNFIPGFISAALYRKAAKVNQGKGKFLAYRRYIHKIGKYGSYPPYKYGILNLVGDFENSCSLYSGDKDRLVHLFSDYFPEGEDAFDSLFHFELENVLVKNLAYTDRTSMANAVECRVPFLDHRIIEFAYSIKKNYKLSSFGHSKKILKDTFSNHIPSYIINRRKAGFGMPLRSIFSSEINVNRLLDKSFFSNFNRFSVESIDRVIKNHLSGKEDNSSIIYALVSFQEWYKLNF